MDVYMYIIYIHTYIQAQSLLGLGATALTGNAEDMHGVALVQMQAAVAGAMHVMLRGASAMGAAVLAVPVLCACACVCVWIDR